MIAHRTAPPVVPAGTKLLGEVLTWSCSGAAVRHADVVAALADAGLDPAIARELAPRHAFTRACKKLSDRRIIRQVAEDETAVKFQFTAEHRSSDRIEYELETMLTLDKKTGTVTCPLPGLATLAQEELDRCIDHRTGGDLTRVVQKLFDRHADLFAIREKGGCYFVPAEHVAFVDRVQAFLGRVNGRLGRFPVPAGTPEGDRSVKEAVADGLAAVIAEYRQAVAGFDADTRKGTVERAAEKIRRTRLKVEGYAELLLDEKARLDRELAAAQAELRARVEALAAEPATA
jgi:hypothetical protein